MNDSSPSDDNPPPGTPRRRGSILKVASDDDGSIDDKPAAKCSHRRRVSFTSVDIAEHDLTLGDHPDCSYGPPTALDWTPRRRHSLDLEEFEAMRCRETGEHPRARTRRHLVISYYKRKQAVQDAGYTNEEIRQAIVEKEKAKTRRNMTRQYAGTPMWRVEHAVSSAARKFKKIMSSKKKLATPDSTTPTTTTALGGIDKKENAAYQVKPGAVTSSSNGSKDKDTSSATGMSDPTKCRVPAPKMKKIASASA